MRKGFRTAGFGTALRIGLSRTGIALLRTSGWMRTRVDLLSDIALPEGEFVSPDRLAAGLSGLIAESKCSNLPATVILADELVRLFMVTPPRNATCLQDCRTAAEMRFRSLYGESAADWQLQADWDVGQPFLACALPNPLLDVLRQVANAHRLTLVEIVPQFIGAWNGWHKSLSGASWFGVAHENLLTLGVISERRLSAIRSTSVPADGWQDQHWLPEHLGREALRLNLTVPQQLQVCGQVPGQWTSQAIGSVTCVRLDGASASVRTTLAHSGVRG